VRERMREMPGALWLTSSSKHRQGQTVIQKPQSRGSVWECVPERLRKNPPITLSHLDTTEMAAYETKSGWAPPTPWLKHHNVWIAQINTIPNRTKSNPYVTVNETVDWHRTKDCNFSINIIRRGFHLKC